MKYSFKPVFLLVFLAIVVVFFIGLNLGKSIERADKTYVPPPPTPTPIPKAESTPEPEFLNYETYSSEKCGISFLIPSDFARRATSNDEIEFNHITGMTESSLFVSCNDSFVDEVLGDLDYDSSESAKLVNQDVTFYKTKSAQIWTVRNKNRKLVFFEVPNSLVPLITQTLELQ